MKLPWFKFFPADFMADEAVMCMDNRQVGVYIRLLCLQWREGSVPADPAKLAALVGENPLDFSTIWEGVAGCFIEAASLPEGRLVNPRLDDIRSERQRAHDKQSAGGRLGGKQSKRKGKRARKGSLSQDASNQKQNQSKPPIPPSGANEGDGYAGGKRKTPTKAQLIEIWNAVAVRFDRKDVTDLTDGEYSAFLERFARFPDFWQAIDRELARLDRKAGPRSWLTLRWLIKSEDNFAKFADGEYADRSKASNDKEKRAAEANEKTRAEAAARLERVEAATAEAWPTGTRIECVMVERKSSKPLLNARGTVEGYKGAAIHVALDEPVCVYKDYPLDAWTFTPGEIRKLANDETGGAAHGAA